MEFISIPTELTTAVTDGILAVIAMFLALSLHNSNSLERYKVKLWQWFFSLLSLVSILGFVAHGFKMSEETHAMIWYLLNFLLLFCLGVLCIAVVYDAFSQSTAKKTWPFMIAIALGFYALTLIWPSQFLVLIIYELFIMVFALGSYAWLAYRKMLPGSWIMASSIVLTIIAAGLQTIHSLAFNFIWVFDHNGIFHLVQMPALVLMFIGIKKTLVARQSKC